MFHYYLSFAHVNTSINNSSWFSSSSYSNETAKKIAKENSQFSDQLNFVECVSNWKIHIKQSSFNKIKCITEIEINERKCNNRLANNFCIGTSFIAQQRSYDWKLDFFLYLVWRNQCSLLSNNMKSRLCDDIRCSIWIYSVEMIFHDNRSNASIVTCYTCINAKWTIICNPLNTISFSRYFHLQLFDFRPCFFLFSFYSWISFFFLFLHFHYLCAFCCCFRTRKM